MAHDDLELRRNRHRMPVQGSTIQQQRAAGPAKRDGELVHQAAHHTDVFVFCPLGCLGEGHPLDGGCLAARQRPGGGELQSGR